MDLKQNIINSFQSTSPSPSLAALRSSAFETFNKIGFPNTKNEAWRFTNIKNLTDKDYSLTTPSSTLSLADIQPFIISQNFSNIVFLNGQYAPQLSSIKEDTFSFSPISEILNSEKSQDLINNYLDKFTHKDDAFTLANTALFTNGFYTHISKSKVVNAPIHFIFLTTASAQNLLTQPRNILVMEPNSQAKIIETHYSLSQNDVLTNTVSEFFVEQDALLDYYKLQNDNLQSSLIDNTFISQKANSSATVHTFTLGGELTRNNLNFYHLGQYLNSTLKGISILNKNQHADHYTLVNHAQENCESHQDYKYILSDNSHGVFNGKIMVEKIAQKTNAYQQNDTILLSPKATINTKPQLEIFADDVKCSHGCTVGELNTDSLFYLQTRGIPKKEAEALLTYAFANTVLQSVTIPELQEHISKLFSQKLGVSLKF